MRYILSLAAAALLTAPFTQAQTDPPAPPAEPTVLVLPLTVTSDAQNEWLGRATQQDLLADLTQGAVARVLAPATAPPPTDQAMALKDAHDANANFVVYGQIQMNGKNIRMTGQMLDVATGKPLGAMKATGPADQLFHLEDALEAQVFSMLPPTLRRAPPRQIAAAQPQTVPQPVIISSPPVVDIEPPVQPQDNLVYPPQVYGDYPSFDDAYPGYASPYDNGYGAYLGGPVIINGYGGYRHGWGDHRGGNRGWNGNTGRGSIVSRGESRFSGGFRGGAVSGFHGSMGGGFHGAAAGGFHGGGHR